MRQHVVLYRCEATFDEVRAIPYAEPPEPGSAHECILFVRQLSLEPDVPRAQALMAAHGWRQVEFKGVGPFVPESINSPQFQVFQRNYEECLKHGDSLVWYR